jgi:glycyl-tRNA synthetase beta chain
MVCEFTELQGIIGAHYARIQGESPEVCDIIRDQYKHVEELTSPLGAVFALADKIDLIVSLFGIGKEPTGSKDPFALRRAAIGVLKIIIKYEITMDLEIIIRKSFVRLGEKVANLVPDTVERVISFIMDRLKIVLKEDGLRHDVVKSALSTALSSSECEILSICYKANIMNDVLKNEIGEKLITIYRRAKNIIQNNAGETAVVDESLFSETDEKKLFGAIGNLEKSLNNLENSDSSIVEKFKNKLTTCISVEDVISNFFINVLVNAEDEKIQKNRINMLVKLVSLFDESLPEISNL